MQRNSFMIETYRHHHSNPKSIPSNSVNATLNENRLGQCIFMRTIIFGHSSPTFQELLELQILTVYGTNRMQLMLMFIVKYCRASVACHRPPAQMRICFDVIKLEHH